MSNPRAVHVKARSVLRERGHNEGDTRREYKDWHIDIRGGLAYVSVWSSAGMVFMSYSGIPVYYRPGPWEQYLDRLFQRVEINGRADGPGRSTSWRPRADEPPLPSADN